MVGDFVSGVDCCREHGRGSIPAGAYAELVAYVKAAKALRK
jgi:hypothetical protein